MRALPIVLAAGAVFVASTAAAQGTSFSARLGRNPVGLGEAFPFEVTLSSEDGRMSDYRPPDFRGFRVHSERPSQSTQIQMGGGGSFMRQVYTWHYELVPVDKGKLTIGPATVRVNGKVLTTERVNVTVVEAGQAPQPPRQRSRFPGGGIPGFPDPSFFFPDLEADPVPEPDPIAPPPTAVPAGRRNFLRVVPSKTRVFVGEQINVEWFLYLSDRQTNYAPTQEPRTDGFWTEELEVPQNARGGLNLTEQVLDGRVYLFAPLMRKALFPLKPGKLTVSSLESDIWRADFFGRTSRKEHLKADPVTIEVVPLPPGAPAGFDPSAVGTLTLAAEVDRNQVQVGDAITLKLRLEGRGNLRKIPLPALPRLDGLKLYDPKIDVQMSRGDDVGGTKTAEYLLLAERPGQVTLPAIALSYFDTAKADYATTKTAPIQLTVTGEAVAAPSAGSTAPATGAPGSENLLAIDVRPIRNRSLGRDFGSLLYRPSTLVGIVAIPPLLLAGVGLIAIARQRLGQETEGKRRRQMRRSANRRLRTATTHLRDGRLAPALAEIERVLREFLTGKIGRPVVGMSRDELRAALASTGARLTLMDATMAVLDTCDRARFAAGSITADEASQAIDRASEIIEDLEKSPNAKGSES